MVTHASHLGFNDMGHFFLRSFSSCFDGESVIGSKGEWQIMENIKSISNFEGFSDCPNVLVTTKNIVFSVIWYLCHNSHFSNDTSYE